MDLLLHSFHRLNNPPVAKVVVFIHFRTFGSLHSLVMLVVHLLTPGLLEAHLLEHEQLLPDCHKAVAKSCHQKLVLVVSLILGGA